MTVKHTGLSSYKKPGRSGRRYRKMINGRCFEKYFYGPKESREKEFKLWVSFLESKYKNRSFDKSHTWTTFCDMFLSFLSSERDKKTGRNVFHSRTISEYRQSLKNFEAVMHPHYLQDIDYSILAEYRRELREEANDQNNDYYGVNKRVGCVLRALKWGMSEGLLHNFDVRTLEKQLRTADVQVRSLTEKEVGLLFKYSTPLMKIIVKMGFYTGMRGGEVINLLFNKIDFKTGLVKISHNEKDEAKGIKEWSPKANKSRVVFFPPDLLKDLLQLKKTSPYVITNSKSAPFDDKTFSKAFSINLERVNKQILHNEPDTPPIQASFKIFRKTNVSALVAKGADEKAASLYLGHADTKVTEKHYLNPQILGKIKEQKQIARVKKLKPELLKLPALLKSNASKSKK